MATATETITLSCYQQINNYGNGLRLWATRACKSMKNMEIIHRPARISHN